MHPDQKYLSLRSIFSEIDFRNLFLSIKGTDASSLSDIRLRSIPTPHYPSSKLMFPLLPHKAPGSPFWGAFHTCLNSCKKPANLFQSPSYHPSEDPHSSHDLQKLISICFCNFYLDVHFIGTISSLVCKFPISLQKAHSAFWGALYFCGCKINCVDYIDMLTDSKLPCSLHGCLLLLHHTPHRLKHCPCSLCPSI